MFEFIESRLLALVLYEAKHVIPFLQQCLGVAPGHLLDVSVFVHENLERSAPIRMLHKAFSFLMLAVSQVFLEPGYSTVFPMMYWYLFDLTLARGVIIIWVLSMITGQIIKDYLALPRPYMVNPAVRNLEERGEFGFPSTHMMSSLGISFVIFDYLCGVQCTHFTQEWCFITAIVGLIAVSRVFHGVHSITDMCGGLIIEVLVLNFFYKAPLFVDFQSLRFPGDMSLLCVSLISAYYFLVNKRPYSESYPSTSLILGVFNGILTAHYMLPDDSFTYNFRSASFGVKAGLYVLGLLLSFVVRIISNFVLSRTLHAVFRVPKGVKSYKVEVPRKFVTYSLIGMSVIYAMKNFDMLLALMAGPVSSTNNEHSDL